MNSISFVLQPSWWAQIVTGFDNYHFSPCIHRVVVVIDPYNCIHINVLDFQASVGLKSTKGH